MTIKKASALVKLLTLWVNRAVSIILVLFWTEQVFKDAGGADYWRVMVDFTLDFVSLNFVSAYWTDRE